MKVLLFNGSPHEKGCTYTALCEVAGALNGEDIETEIVQVGKEEISGCTGCLGCRKTGRCVKNDIVNTVIDMTKTADGFVFGSPVYYASPNGTFISFMDRLFYTGGGAFAYKPGAYIISARRAGTTAALDVLNKYLTISCMPVVSSHYWNMVHGNTPEEVKRDLEGLQTMRALGRNMAWILRCIKAGKDAGIDIPERETRVRTNFIR